MANADVARSYFFNGSPHHHLSTESLMEEVHMSMEGLALSPSGSTSTSPSSSCPSLAASLSDDFDWCRMDLPPLSPSSPAAHTSTPSSSPLHYNNGGSQLMSTSKTWPSPSSSSSSSADFFFADWASRLIGTTTMLELQLTSAMAGIDGTKCSAVAEAPQLPFKALR